MCNTTGSPCDDDEKISSFMEVIKRSKRKRNRNLQSEIVSQSSVESSLINYSSLRKTRSKTRRPKYFSLKRKLNNPNEIPKQEENPHQSNLEKFKSMEEEEDKLLDLQYDTVAAANYFFNDISTPDTTISISTINDLLHDSSNRKTSWFENKEEEEEDRVPVLSPPSSLTYGSFTGGDHLVRTAMRCRESYADAAVEEERWVCYSEVMSSCNAVVAVSTGSIGCVGGAGECDVDAADPTVEKKQRLFSSLDLKLDYDQILNAWSDKGPLYIEVESPQTVPDLHTAASNLFMDGWGNGDDIWRVPEMGSDVGGFQNGVIKEIWKKEQRKASMLRYKEKRQNRLFAKRIRYEVRKLNAEKRPRMKGRFVKLS